MVVMGATDVESPDSLFEMRQPSREIIERVYTHAPLKMGALSFY